MKRHLLTLMMALTTMLSVNAQTFEWGTATWNIEDGKTFADIEEFNAAQLTLSYNNPANYTLTFLNIIAVDYDLYIDDATEPLKAFATAQGSTDVVFDYGFVEGHKYKIVTTSALLVQANLATFKTDTLSINNDSYQISFSIQGPELVKTIDVEGTMALTITDQEYFLTYSKVDVADILSSLGASSIDEVKIYGLNLNGSYNEHFIDYYDGWHDADGGFTTWNGGYDSYAGHNAYPAVYGVKLNETGDTVKYYFYDYWMEYDPEANDSTGGSVITNGKKRFVPETSYNTIIWDWDNGDGTVTQYRRNYRCEEGKDYKASFIYVANRKSVVLNATLHFVSQEAYIEYLNSLTNEKTYEGFIASGLAMMQDPGTPIITTNEAQSVTISEKDNGVVVKFSGFTIPMMGMETGELELNAVKTVAENGSITYSAEPTVVGIARGGMLINYTATLKGTQANEEATPVLVLTLSQATVVTTVFGATTEDASAALLSEYAALGINDVVSTGVGVQGIYKLNGTRQQSMQKGINIIKTSEGVKKVYVK